MLEEAELADRNSFEMEFTDFARFLAHNSYKRGGSSPPLSEKNHR
jgi:hypothetical protein